MTKGVTVKAYLPFTGRKMSKVVFAGSFDPITVGHVDLIKRASLIFDEVIVGVLVNVDKTYVFPMDCRTQAVKACCRQFENVTVKSYDGFLADFLRQEGTNLYLRGIRSEQDFKYECEIKLLNEELYPEIEYVFLVAKDEYKQMSSTLVRQMLLKGEDVSQFVPKEALKELNAYFTKKDKKE